MVGIGESGAGAPLRIVHCVRSAAGGTFRHISDLAREQVRRGHLVGIALDTTIGGAHEARAIAALAPVLQLGVTQLPMTRAVTPRDLLSAHAFYKAVRDLKPDVLHGHGAKGGVLARMIGGVLRLFGHPVARFYTPHGGSLHFAKESLQGRVFFAAERRMERWCEGIIHVSAYEAGQYRSKIGVPRCGASVIVNGLRAEEFEPVVPDADAADVMVMGMLRLLKGQDVLIKALALLRERTGKAPSARLIGDGPDEASYRAMVGELGLTDAVSFLPLMPTRTGFAKARVLVVPSRAESLPYIVLEAAAAGLPLIVSNVGGVPEIFGQASDRLVPAGDAEALSRAIEEALGEPDAALARAGALQAAIRDRFTVETMADNVETLYRGALAQRAGRRSLAPARLSPAE